MAEIKEVNFSGWDKFKRDFTNHLFGEQPFQNGRYLFRGHGSARWDLTPSYDRRLKNLPDDERSYQIGRELYDEFLAALRQLEDTKNIENDERIVLALGQHYGMPTKLLDWTEEPNIAAFFAFSDKFRSGEEGDVAIWAMDTTNRIWSRRIYGVDVIKPISPVNARLLRQHGKFTLCRNQFKSLEDYIRDHKDDATTPLIKFILPASEADHALEDLDTLGINHLSLFPDYEGAVLLSILRVVRKHGLALSY